MTIEADLEALRGPLNAYCYRMLAGSSECEDAVQETMIRALRELDTFDSRRARLTTWVHRIAHNVCIDMLRAAQRRASPMDVAGLGEPGVFGAAAPLGSYVDPVPGSVVVYSSDPARRAVERETVRLAFVAALQHLTPPQRAVTILRDVLAFSAAETADILGVSVGAINSSLQRARGVLPAQYGGDGSVSDEQARALAERYVAAFEAHDVGGLIAVLHDDVTTTMPPVRWWLAGREAIASLVAVSDACAADRLVITDINGQVGFGQYRPDAVGTLRPFALVAVEFRGGLIGHTTTFLGTADRFAEFGLPPTLPPDNA